MTVTELHDPRSALVDPPGPAEDFADSLRWKAGALLGGLDWLVTEITGVSAIAALVEPLSGDWAALEKSAQAWRAAANATLAVSENVAAMSPQAQAEWLGAAAEAFGARAESVAECFGEYAEGCGAMAEVTAALIDLCKATAETIAGILGFIGDYLTRLLIEAAIPVIGWVAGALDGLVSSALLIKKLHAGYRALERVVTFIERFRSVLLVIRRIGIVITTLTRAIRAGVNVRSVTIADGAASTAFGVP